MPETKTIQTTKLTTYALDAYHSAAEFSVRHLMVTNVKGRIGIRAATLDISDDLKKINLEAELDVATINTGVADRDTHLRSADFFDVENHPTMRFVATRIQPKGDDEYRVTGHLHIRGVTREIELAVEKVGDVVDTDGNTRVGLAATTTIDRRDFGLTWNAPIETGGVLVGDRVKIALDLAFVKQN